MIYLVLLLLLNTLTVLVIPDGVLYESPLVVPLLLGINALSGIGGVVYGMTIQQKTRTQP